MLMVPTAQLVYVVRFVVVSWPRGQTGPVAEAYNPLSFTETVTYHGAAVLLPFTVLKVNSKVLFHCLTIVRPL